MFNIRKNKKYNFLIKKKFLNTKDFFIYLIITFFVVFLIYLTIPKFYNFKSKEDLITSNLIQKFSIKIDSVDNISYKIFPTPRLVIKKAPLELVDKNIISENSSLSLILEISKILNLKTVNIKKIKIKETDFKIKTKNLYDLLKFKENTKIVTIKNSNLLFQDGDKNIFRLNDINFINNNNLDLSAKLFNKKIKIKYKKNVKNNISIKLPEIDANFLILIDKNSTKKNYAGKAKLKLLQNRLKFDFQKKDIFKITNSFFRNKHISSSFDGEITFKPNTYFDIFLDLKKINIPKIKSILLSNYSTNFNEIIKTNKKLNGKVKIKYDVKNYNSLFINKFEIESTLSNGNLNITKGLFEIADGTISLNGIKSDTNGDQRFDFSMTLDIQNKKNFLRKFNIYNAEESSMNIKINGSLKIDTNQINFNSVVINNLEKIDNQDLDFYKKNFEEFVIKGSAINILDFFKLKQFVKSIY